MPLRRAVAIVMAGCLAAATGLTATADVTSVALAKAKADDPQLTISFSGSTDKTTTYDDPLLGTEKIHIEWDLQWSGPLSKLTKLDASGRSVNFSVRNLVGSLTRVYPPPNEKSNCGDAFSAGPYQQVYATLDNGDLNLTVLAPLTTAFTKSDRRMLATPVGLSCIDLSHGQTNSIYGAPPTPASPANAPDPTTSTFVYDLSKGSMSKHIAIHPTDNSFGVHQHWDYQSTLSISGRSCAGSGSGARCDPQAVALQWARAIPVLRDRVGPSSPPSLISEASTSYTAACLPANKMAEYVACPEQRPTKLVPSKNWPVVVQGGTHPSFKEVTVFIPPAPFPIGGAKLVGTATVDGTKLTFTGTDRHASSKPNLWTFDGVSADRVWPQKVLDLSVTSGHPLAISWQIVLPTKGKKFAAGTTLADVFVTRKAPATGAGKPYLSLIYPAVRDATGASSTDKTVAGVWKAFQTANRQGLHRYELQPSTGQIMTGSLLQFWPTGWSPQAAFSHAYHVSACPADVDGLLAVGVATCNGFADYQVTMLRLLGVAADRTAPNLVQGFVPHLGSQFFLVNTWTFLKTTPTNMLFYDADYPYAIGFHYPAATGGAAGTPTVSPSDEVTYASATGQGNPTPPSMWGTSSLIGIPYITPGDHALVSVPGQAKPIFDPSYGTGPFSGIVDWAQQSFAGWARVVDENGRVVPNPDDCGVAYQTCYLLIHRGA